MSRDVVLAMRVERVAYGSVVALRDVALDVHAGEIVGIAGHVGAGKTTLALAAAGLLGRATPGRITGTVTHPAGGRPPASFVFANPWTQLTELGGTVEEEVAVGPENQARPPAEIRERVDRALALADAAPLARRIPRELSGGELQRVALASALALDAPLIVLDEPTAQLDPEATARFAGALRALRDGGAGVLLVEQNLELLLALADRLLVLADGTPIADGVPGPLLERWPPLDARLGAPRHVVDREVPVMRAPSSGEPLLEVNGVRAGYDGREVLRGITLEVPRGSAVAWLGENGAGKSTLARTIMGLVPARAGTISVEGRVLDALPVEARARHVGLVFQDPGRQLFSRTVLEEAMFGPRALRLPREAALASAREALEVVGLGEMLQVHPGDLTPQAQRRLAIAAAMASRPALLILDEPTAGQDAQGREWISRALGLQRTRGAAAVITHDLGFAHRACDRAVTIASGHVSINGMVRPVASNEPS